MKTQKRIFIAFLLNALFSIFEFIGGVLSGSVAILSDAVHDLGDATSIGISYFLEKKSKNKPDEKYTYGYARFSVLGSLITVCVLLIGSALVIYNAVLKILNPTQIKENTMILFAIVGVLVNFIAALFTSEGHSLNQKAVNLHLLEDVLGWLVVLIGAVVIKYTSFVLLDPIISIAVAIFVLINAIKLLKEVFAVFLEKAPNHLPLPTIQEELLKIEGVEEIHHLHLWTIDGENHYATLHAVINGNACEIKAKIRQSLEKFSICHATIETELVGEVCEHKNCSLAQTHAAHAHHHHHHGHAHKHEHEHAHEHGHHE